MKQAHAGGLSLVAVAHSVQATPSVCACKYFLHQMHAAFCASCDPMLLPCCCRQQKKQCPHSCSAVQHPAFHASSNTEAHAGGPGAIGGKMLHRLLSCHSML